MLFVSNVGRRVWAPEYLLMLQIVNASFRAFPLGVWRPTIEVSGGAYALSEINLFGLRIRRGFDGGLPRVIYYRREDSHLGISLY